MVGPQLFAEEHILVAIIAETLIEGVGEHQVATDEEVGGVEVLIGAFPAHLRGVLALGGFLVEVAQVPLRASASPPMDTPPSTTSASCWAAY